MTERGGVGGGHCRDFILSSWYWEREGGPDSTYSQNTLANHTRYDCNTAPPLQGVLSEDRDSGRRKLFEYRIRPALASEAEVGAKRMEALESRECVCVCVLIIIIVSGRTHALSRLFRVESAV